MHRLSLVVASGATLCCSARASHCSGFSCCGAQALRAQASVVVARGLSSCGSRALERRLSSCGARAYSLRGMWDPPGPGLEPVSPAWAGGFLTTAPPGKPRLHFFCLTLILTCLRLGCGPGAGCLWATSCGHRTVQSLRMQDSKLAFRFVMMAYLSRQEDRTYFI